MSDWKLEGEILQHTTGFTISRNRAIKCYISINGNNSACIVPEREINGCINKLLLKLIEHCNSFGLKEDVRLFYSFAESCLNGGLSRAVIIDSFPIITVKAKWRVSKAIVCNTRVVYIENNIMHLYNRLNEVLAVSLCKSLRELEGVLQSSLLGTGIATKDAIELINLVNDNEVNDRIHKDVSELDSSKKSKGLNVIVNDMFANYIN